MTAIMYRWASAGVAALLMWSATVSAEEADNAIVKLRQEQEGLLQQARRTERLVDMLQHAQGRKQEAAQELAEIILEEPESTSEKAWMRTRMAHADARVRLLDAILQIRSHTDFDKAEKLMREVELLEREWDLVIAPRHQAAMQLEEVEAEVQNDNLAGARAELLLRLREVYKADETARKAEFEAVKARLSREAEWQKMLEQFHSGQ